MSNTLMIVASFSGYFGTPLLSNSITTSFRSVLGFGDWNLSTCLSGNLVTNLSRDLSFYLILDSVTLLLRFVLGNLSVFSGTFLSIFSVAGLPWILITLLPGNLLALLSGFIPTLLSGLIPALLLTIDIAALPLG